MYCYKDGNDCPYRDTCKERTSDGECSKMCLLFNQIDYMMYRANIPKLYTQPIKLQPANDIDKNTFDNLKMIKDNIDYYVYIGSNIYIRSNYRHSGKTSWAIKLLQNMLHKSIGKPGKREIGYYLEVSEFFRDLKVSFDSKDKSMEEIEKIIRSCKLLVLDGIDEVRLSDYERNYLRMLIKKRIANKLSNIYVGRKTGGDLINMVGDDLAYYMDTAIPIVITQEGGNING